MADNTDAEHALAKAMRACELLVVTVNATGGVRQLEANGAWVPNGDWEWLDLGEAAVEADRTLDELRAAGYPQILDEEQYGVLERLIKHEFQTDE